MSKQDFDEKQDEKDEKERSKHEEKSVEEKFQRDPLNAVVWALILIWAGLVFLAGNLGLLDAYNQFWNSFGIERAELPVDFPLLQLDAWSLVFLGAGVILLLEVAARLLLPAYRKPVLGTSILAIVFIGLAIGSWGLIWPLILIVVGLAIIFGGRRRK